MSAGFPSQYLPSHVNAEIPTCGLANEPATSAKGASKSPTPDARDVKARSRRASASRGTKHESKGRLRKACDSCSIRKVKCDESGPPCKACAALEIPCTFDRPSRRRGPPNRHAEAIRRQKLMSGSLLPCASSAASPSSPTRAGAQVLASLAQPPPLSVESICPLSTLYLLIDDFFTYIHPLVPIPHEPSFRAALARREDLRNRKFLALVASMIASLVASFPRKPHMRVKSARANIPNSVELIERCHRIVGEARGPGYLDGALDIYDPATSYFMALSGGYVFKWKKTGLYFAEAVAMARNLGLFKIGLPSDMSSESGHESHDYISQELAKRLVWVIYVGVRSLHQWGASFREIVMLPQTPTNPYPPLPLEVDDAYIFPDHIDPQPASHISKISGFNYNVRVYCTYDTLTSSELVYGIDQIFDWETQKQTLQQCLHNVKHVLDALPRELRLNPCPVTSPVSSWDNHSSAGSPTTSLSQPSGSPAANAANAANADTLSPDERRSISYEIQKANIYVSQLSTRSYLVEKYYTLAENRRAIQVNLPGLNSPSLVAAGLEPRIRSERLDLCERLMFEEREQVVRDLLVVLSSIRPIDMEPNGGSFTFKIRQIASTLLDVPRTRKGEIAQKVELYLKAFVDILMKLEHSGSSGQEGESEEEELRNWADLRDHQRRFLQAGGFTCL